MITDITPIQNDPDGQTIVSVNNPVNIFADVEYTGDAPTYILADVYGIDIFNQYSELLGTFKPFIYSVGDDIVQFRLDGETIFNGVMPLMDDFYSKEKTVEFVTNATREIQIVFKADDGSGIEASMRVIILRTATQIGETLDLKTRYQQELCYVGGENLEVYIYMFNDDINNKPEVIDPNVPEFTEEYAADDDLAIFRDDDGSLFKFNRENS